MKHVGARAWLLPGLAVLGLALAAGAGHGFERTEEREPCADHDPLRRPLFGDTHVHSSYSFDANALGVRNAPADAWRFARGERLGIPPYDAAGHALRSVQLERPLDFAVVTDHAELLGELRICTTPGMTGHDSLICTLMRRWPLLAYYVVNSAIFNIAEPVRYSFCGEDGAICRDAAAAPWLEIQRAAEQAYDRSASCRFSSFVGYEWSPNPDSKMIHRNIVFRNERVQAVPANYIDDRGEEALWRSLERDCLERGDGCDVLVIPHNSNLSGGLIFPLEKSDGRPIDAEQARRRMRIERLIEVIQHKGASECRVDGAAPDELCGFELLPFATMDQYPFELLWTRPPPLVYAREVLAEGLAQQRRLGVNPFKYGLIGSSDSHLGTPGLVDEATHPGHAAGGDTSRIALPVVPDQLFFNPGGLAVAWAEENSRDALFAALRRREVYGTSGPRIVLRSFGGWDFPADVCSDPELAAKGYAAGVPMGGDLPPRPGELAPALLVHAMRDADTPSRPGVGLERVQVIKAWEEGGRARERVYEMMGDVSGLASVDPDTCAPTRRGADSLCGVWRDPDFDPSRAALYYVRVLENPSCRWSTHVCLAAGVDCSAADALPRELAYCCEDEVPRTIRERAWSSPIWYTPGPGAQSAR